MDAETVRANGMRATPSISVLLPILNGARHLGRVLAGLAAQRYAGGWDFLALDCGSIDGTLAIFHDWSKRFPVPFSVRGIHREEFNHGCTRNLLAALSSGELLVFITDDAIPIGTDWLERLASNFADERVAAAYCRNVTRPEADILVRLQNDADPAYGTSRSVAVLPAPEHYARLSLEQRRRLYNYCDSASAMRRDLWERHPYVRCTFGEDVMQARAFLEAGYRVVFDASAAVEHSHDFDATEQAQRARLDGEFQVEWLGIDPVPTEASARRMARRAVRADCRALWQAGYRGRRFLAKALEARALRRAFFLGLHRGSRSRRREPLTHLLPSRGLTIDLMLPARLDDRRKGAFMALVPLLEAHGHRLRPRATPNEGAGAPADLVHFVSPGPDALAWLSDRARSGQPCLVHLQDEHDLDVGEDVLQACRAAELTIAASVSVRARLIAEHGFERVHTAVLELGDSQSGAPRPDAWVAGELAFRYRALACRAGERPAAPLARIRGADCVSSRGDVRACLSGAMVLGPAPASVEYALPETNADLAAVELVLGSRGLHNGSACAGRIALDGRTCYRFGPLRFERDGELRSLRVPLRAGGVRRIEIENSARNGASGVLRVEELVLRPVQGRRRPRERALSLAATLAGGLGFPLAIDA